MDRSRILIAFLLISIAFSLLIGLVNVAVAGRGSEFAASAESFFSTGRAGVAVVRIEGPIVDGYGSGGDSGADRIVARLKEARHDSSVRGVILAINSPGGSVGGTKKIYDEVIRLREAKPTVAVISSIAASGGYYVAAAAEKIYAYPSAILGSIGVISFHLNVSGLLRQYGVQVLPIKSGRYKDSSYPFRNMTNEELDMRESVQQAAYTQFIRDVADGRKERFSDVQNKWADARIFSGEQARREKLIDEFGDNQTALEYIKKKLDTKRDLPLLEPKRDFFEDLLRSLPGVKAQPSAGRWGALLSEPVLYLYPDNMGLLADLKAAFPSGAAR